MICTCTYHLAVFVPCDSFLHVAPIFTAVDLADYARQLDEEEQATMAEGGFTNPEFLRFMQVIQRL